VISGCADRLKEVGDMLSHVVAHMATKERYRRTRRPGREHRTGIKDDRPRPQQAERGRQNIFGYRKEIDHAFDRIAAIEKRPSIRMPWNGLLSILAFRPSSALSQSSGIPSNSD
jgi:hypothetical protein